MNKILVAGLLVSSMTWIVLAQERSGQQDAPAKPQNPVSESEHGATHHGPAMKIEFENDRVQVIRVRIGPHEKIPMHDILTPRVQVLLTDEHLRIIFPNGETKEVSAKAGETMWLEPQHHAGENLSDSPIEFISVVPKEK